MEFVQYHPTGLPFTGILITEAARAEGGYLINKDGYRYLQDYNLGTPEPKPVLRSMELGPRDRLSQAFVKEVEKGRTIDSPYGPVVHLDLRHLGAKAIESRIPFVREHGGERLAVLRDEMQKAMDEGAGIYRKGDSLRHAADRLSRLRERFARVTLDDDSLTFNTERVAGLELAFMLDVAEAIVHSALQREESRGAHQRTDFPARDDQRFLAHSLIHRRPDGSVSIEYLPVTITRWPPAERVYGR